MDSWQYDDIPISKNKVITEPNLITGEIKQITEIAGKITEEIIRTKSDQVRNALIDLKWTPPEGGESIPPSKLGPNFRDHWLPRVRDCLFMGIKVEDLPLFDILAIVAYLFDQKIPHKKERP